MPGLNILFGLYIFGQVYWYGDSFESEDYESLPRATYTRMDTLLFFFLTGPHFGHAYGQASRRSTAENAGPLTLLYLPCFMFLGRKVRVEERDERPVNTKGRDGGGGGYKKLYKINNK